MLAQPVGQSPPTTTSTIQVHAPLPTTHVGRLYLPVSALSTFASFSVRLAPVFTVFSVFRNGGPCSISAILREAGAPEPHRSLAPGILAHAEAYAGAGCGQWSLCPACECVLLAPEPAVRSAGCGQGRVSPVSGRRLSASHRLGSPVHRKQPWASLLHRKAEGGH